MNAADAAVSNTDNDTAGITVTPTAGLVTTEAGGTATFTVVLTSQPAAPVTIALSSSDPTEGTVSPPTLVFTPANWNVARTVTATGVADLLADGNVGYTIITAAAVSADPAYTGLDPADVSVTNQNVPNPTVTGVSSTAADGSYGAGAVIPITVTFDAPVSVGGVPTLALNSGGTASYAGGSGTAALTFTYTVGAGQTSADLDYASAAALSLNGGSLAAGVPAVLTLPAPGAAGSLGASRAIVIDTTAPTLTAFRVLYGAQSFDLLGSPRAVLPWQVTGVRAVFSEPIAGGAAASLLGLPGGAPAGVGTSTLTWTFAALADGAYAAAGLAGAGANALTDAAGNAFAGLARGFSVLYGDVTGDGRVTADDLRAVQAAMGGAADPFANLDGLGGVTSSDYNIARGRLGRRL